MLLVHIRSGISSSGIIHSTSIVILLKNLPAKTHGGIRTLADWLVASYGATDKGSTVILTNITTLKVFLWAPTAREMAGHC